MCPCTVQLDLRKPVHSVNESLKPGADLVILGTKANAFIQPSTSLIFQFLNHYYQRLFVALSLF